MFARTLVATLSLAIFTVPTVQADEKKDIVDTAVAAGSFKTLAVALTEAGLVDTLKSEGPFTVFAPTDEAFKKIPEEKLKAVLADKETLTKILKAHVVIGKKVMAADAVGLVGNKVNGFELKKGDKGLMLGKANIVKTDIDCSNGVIHVIDTVLIPE